MDGAKYDRKERDSDAESSNQLCLSRATKCAALPPNDVDSPTYLRHRHWKTCFLLLFNQRCASWPQSSKVIGRWVWSVVGVVGGWAMTKEPAERIYPSQNGFSDAPSLLHLRVVPWFLCAFECTEPGTEEGEEGEAGGRRSGRYHGPRPRLYTASSSR